MADLDYIWSISQIILTAVLIILTYLYVRDTRRLVLSTKVDYLSRIYDRKCETIHNFIMVLTSCNEKTRQQFASLVN